MTIRGWYGVRDATYIDVTLSHPRETKFIYGRWYNANLNYILPPKACSLLVPEISWFCSFVLWSILNLQDVTKYGLALSILLVLLSAVDIEKFSVRFYYSVDADMEDYGFEYSEEEPEEQDVDIENQYYNSKGMSTNILINSSYDHTCERVFLFNLGL